MSSIEFLALVTLDCIGTFFSGSDANDFLNPSDKNLAVAYLSRARASRDGLANLHSFLVGYKNLNLDLGQEIDGVFRAAIKVSVTLLATEPFHFADCHSLDPQLR